jgi:hypothetical protein
LTCNSKFDIKSIFFSKNMIMITTTNFFEGCCFQKPIILKGVMLKSKLEGRRSQKIGNFMHCLATLVEGCILLCNYEPEIGNSRFTGVTSPHRETPPNPCQQPRTAQFPRTPTLSRHFRFKHQCHHPAIAHPLNPPIPQGIRPTHPLRTQNPSCLNFDSNHLQILENSIVVWNSRDQGAGLRCFSVPPCETFAPSLW